MGAGIDMHINEIDMRNILRKMDLLGEKISGRGLRGVMGKAMTPVATQARKNIRASHRTGSGLLAKSIGKKSKSYKKGLAAIAVVGPRFGMGKTVQRVIPIAPFISTVYSDPAKYAHLVHDGASIRWGGWWAARTKVKGGTSFPGSKFLERAFEAKKSSVMQRLVYFFKQRIEKEWAKRS